MVHKGKCTVKVIPRIKETALCGTLMIGLLSCLQIVIKTPLLKKDKKLQ